MIKKSFLIHRPKIFSKINLNLIVLLLIVALMPVTVYVVTQQQDIRQRASANDAEFVVSSNIENVNPGESLALAININTKSNPVNSVQLNLTYPQDKFEVPVLDTKDSSFDIQNEYIAGSGLVRISRQVQVPVTGEKRVATIVFNAKQQATAEDIKIVPGSSILRSTDNANLYSGTVTENQTKRTENVGDSFLSANSKFWDFVYSSFFPSIFSVFQK